MLPCHRRACAAMLHTMPAVDCTLTNTCASPRMLATCWQDCLSVPHFMRLRAQVGAAAGRRVGAARHCGARVRDRDRACAAFGSSARAAHGRRLPRADVPHCAARLPGGHVGLYVGGEHGQEVVRWARARACDVCMSGACSDNRRRCANRPRAKVGFRRSPIGDCGAEGVKSYGCETLPASCRVLELMFARFFCALGPSLSTKIH